jgi:tetratricopeptide (TPR) repeat protein
MNTRLNIRHLGCVLLLAGACCAGHAQNKLPETHYKYRVTKKVFQDLINVFASSRGRPTLEIIAKGKKNPVIALYVSQPISVVKIDEELYDLCRQLGQDSLAALAGVLGHELSHYYLQHAYSNSFGTNLVRPPVSQEDLQQIESSADKTSVFFSTLAGYETVRVFPVVMDKIYQYYNRPSQLAGYPSLQERKNIYRQLSLQVRQRIAVFQAGQFLYAIQNFESAALCFKDLLNDFPSREMHNNLAAARLQQVLRLLNPNEHPFKYPVEFDYTSRLETFARATPHRTAELLQEAIGALHKAIELDPVYVPARVNLACAYVLQGNYYKAIGEIAELNKGNLSADARTIQAIAFYKIGDAANAKKNFEAAVQLEGFQAGYNLSAYQKLAQGEAPEAVRKRDGGPAAAASERKTIPASEATPISFRMPPSPIPPSRSAMTLTCR